jgi:hypothetical protein
MPVLRRLLLFPLLLFPLFPATLSAQENSLEALLPVDTLFYISWHGGSSLAAHRGTNSLLRLWDDPALAEARALAIGGISASATQSSLPLTPAEGELLLANPLLFAMTKIPPGVKQHELPPGQKEAAPGSSQGKVSILLYDRTGHEELSDKLLTWIPPGQPAATISKTSFHGVEIEKFARGTLIRYRARVSHYVVDTDYEEVTRDWVTRLSAARPERGTLFGSADYRSARDRLDPGAALTLFQNLRAIVDLAAKGADAAKVRQVLDALHFNRMHSLTVSVSFADPSTRLQFSLLGDLSPGSVFDLIGPSGPAFPTLEYTPAPVFSYSSTRLDFSALLRMAREVFTAVVPPGQGLQFDQFESMATAQLGMSLSEILRLLSGDFTFIKKEATTETTESIFAVGVEKPADVIHVLELLFTGNITNEEEHGKITYITFLSPATAQAGSAKPQRHFYHLAIGPKLLVVAKRKAAAETFFDQAAAGDHTKSLAADPLFLASRAYLPKNLSALSYADLTRVNWKDVLDKVGGLKFSGADPAKVEMLKKMVPTEAFSRYLHVSIGGMWKDRQGLYYDTYIE